MSDEERELAQLRRRAYGPGADIATDPAALARLRELESRRSAADGGSRRDGAAAPTHPVDGGDDATAPRPGPAAMPVGVASPGADRTHSENRSGPRVREGEAGGAGQITHAKNASAAPRHRGPVWWWWLVTAGAVVIAVAIVVALQPRPAAVLYPQPGGPEPSIRNSGEVMGMFGEEFLHAAFRDVDIWAQPEGQHCLVVEAPSGDGISSMPACRRSAFPTSLEMTVGFGLDPDAVGGLQRGTGVRFVNHGDRVDVWIRPPGPDAPGPMGR